MQIKTRLYSSNILLIAVPVFLTVMMAIGCGTAVWHIYKNGVVGFEDSEDFYRASKGISELAEKALRSDAPEKRDKSLHSLSEFLDRGALSLQIVSDGALVYRYGDEDVKDAQLLSAVALFGGEGSASDGGRSLYARRIAIDGTDYRILLFGSDAPLSYDTLKNAVIVAFFILMATLGISIWLTDRFLIRFVYRHIEEPLDILSEGVRQIRDGNLDYRILYEGGDEFSRVCDDFNEMAFRLRQSVTLTQQHERSRRELMAGISHDLRSPLTSIQAYVEGLLDGVASTPEMQRRYLTTIKSKAEDIDRMVRQIFLFSKMELDDYPYAPVILRLDGEIEELLQSVGEEYAEKGLKIETELTHASVRADPELLRRVLLNITENALKYKTKPVGTLRISLAADEKRCRLVLADDGPGVPPEQHARLFDAFYRSDPARREPCRGSGLGLSIAENAVRRMGGTISAGSSALGGLAIEIDLPKAVTYDAEAPDR